MGSLVLFLVSNEYVNGESSEVDLDAMDTDFVSVDRGDGINRWRGEYLTEEHDVQRPWILTQSSHRPSLHTLPPTKNIVQTITVHPHDVLKALVQLN